MPPADHEGVVAPLRVMTLNLRRDVDHDRGATSWAERAKHVSALLCREVPHVLATQEGLAHQLGELDRARPWRRVPSRCRRGDGSDEHMGVHYDPTRLRLLAHEDVWLSGTPDAPGSRSFGNRLPRMATAAAFEDLRTGGWFRLVNTHFDHESEGSRARAASLLAARFPDAILAGDFNDVPGSLPHATFTSASWRDAQAGATEGTFHAWRGVRDRRIDWVLLPPHVALEAARTLGDLVSDHYAVVADVRLTGARAPSARR